MELTVLFISIASIASFFVLDVLMRSFLPAYSSEKAKNLASKEDISHLTHLVESVKAEYSVTFEKLKATIAIEGQVVERRRKVYEDICSALRVFVAGHENSDEAKDRFHAAYASSWLWASEEVLAALNYFVETQLMYAATPSSISQSELKLSYAAVLLGMRKDAGFPETSVAAAEYKFVHF